jgi:hypothetical protein
VANVDSIGFFVRVDPVLGGVGVDGQQYVEVVGYLRDGLVPLGAVEVGECLSGFGRVVIVLGVVHLDQRSLAPGALT